MKLHCFSLLSIKSNCWHIVPHFSTFMFWVYETTKRNVVDQIAKVLREKKDKRLLFVKSLMHAAQITSAMQIRSLLKMSEQASNRLAFR